MGTDVCGIWGHREEAQRPLHETMRLAEARLERHAPGGSMPSEAPKHCKIQSRRDAPKMAILEAPCAQNAPGRSTMRPPEALLPRNPSWESPHFSGLSIELSRMGAHHLFRVTQETSQGITLPTSIITYIKISFEIYFKITYVENYVRFRFQNEIFLLRWTILLAVEMYGAHIQLQYAQNCVKMCFGNLITSTIRQNLRLIFLDDVV